MRLPDFLIAGTAKAGTTSLYYYLCQHPQVFARTLKELNYFAYGDPVVTEGWPHLPFRAKTWEAYLEFFASAPADHLTGEASPIYFDSPQAVSQIAQRLPQTKVIISLRDPRARAYSGYLMHVREGHKPLTDDQFLESNARFIVGGFYFEKLCRYFEQIDRDRLKIVLFDDIRSDIVSVMRDLYEFLGLEDKDYKARIDRKHNVASYPRLHGLNAFLTNEFVKKNVAPMMPAWIRQSGRKLIKFNRGAAPRLTPELRARLTEVYRSDVLKVQDLIDRDLSMWLQDDE